MNIIGEKDTVAAGGHVNKHFAFRILTDGNVPLLQGRDYGFFSGAGGEPHPLSAGCDILNIQKDIMPLRTAEFCGLCGNILDIDIEIPSLNLIDSGVHVSDIMFCDPC